MLVAGFCGKTDRNPFKPTIPPGSRENSLTPCGFIEREREIKIGLLSSDKEKCPGFKWTSTEKSSLQANLLEMWWENFQAQNCVLDTLPLLSKSIFLRKKYCFRVLMPGYSTLQTAQFTVSPAHFPPPIWHQFCLKHFYYTCKPTLKLYQ